MLLLFSLLILAASCSGKTAVKTGDAFDAEKYFEKANKLIEAKDYNEARAVLLEVKNRDLTKKFAPLAQMRIADSYMLEEEPERAIEEYRRFMEIYPDHRHASYAQYQIAMAYFGQIEGADRGYGGAARALAEFERLKRNYPRNPFKEVVDLRIEKCKNVMADYELLVGRFYMKKESWNAAIGRFTTLLKKFPDYRMEADALLDLGICYKKIGRNDQAEEQFKRLVDKYPNSILSAAAAKELASLKAAAK